MRQPTAGFLFPPVRAANYTKTAEPIGRVSLARGENERTLLATMRIIHEAAAQAGDAVIARYPTCPGIVTKTGFSPDVAGPPSRVSPGRREASRLCVRERKGDCIGQSRDNDSFGQRSTFNAKRPMDQVESFQVPHNYRGVKYSSRSWIDSRVNSTPIGTSTRCGSFCKKVRSI